MKKIFYFSLFFLSVGFSLQAMEGVQLESFRLGDHGKQAQEVYKNAFASPIPAILNQGYDSEHVKHAFVLTKQAEVIGLVIYKNHTAGQFITHFAISRASQGKGYGKLLMKKFEEKAQREGVKTIQLVSLSPTVPFYEKLGFVTSNYDDDRMIKNLK